jgi:phosphoenolpyruvate synthase/pyruvate phosphate dikinase
VNREKWPWQTEPEDGSCIPPPKSREFVQLEKFMKRTNFSIHFLPVPIKFKYHPVEELIAHSKFYTLPNKKRIRIYKISKDLKERVKTLLKEDLSTWKRETVKRWLKYFFEIEKIARRKKDEEIVKICQKALKKLEKIREEFELKTSLEEVPKVFQINGLIAYKGKVRGKAQIVFDSNQLLKFKKGNILVTPMTTPEFLPIIERARFSSKK